MPEKKKTNRDYFLVLVYNAPENSVDENGKPVKVFQRAIGLDKQTYHYLIEQMEEGKVRLFLPGKIKFKNGSPQEKKMSYINLDNRELIRAETVIQEYLPEEEAKEMQKSGKSPIYRPDGRAYS
ncbi:MAG: hypothetical protein GF313_09400 [Caldithrix sp.]|nr:hypothetical protein [Caldithrix sp.]